VPEENLLMLSLVTLCRRSLYLRPRGHWDRP